MGQKAIDIMESFQVSHLPVVHNGEYLGLISEDEIYNKELEMCDMGESVASLNRPFVRATQHVFEVVKMMKEVNVSVLPVLEIDDEYVGSITFAKATKLIVDAMGTQDVGAIMVLELNAVDYSLSQISQIVESNDAKILSLFTQLGENTNEMEVTLKLNIIDVSSIIQTFVRYDYNIKAVYMDNSLLKDMYSERYDLFMKYMDI